MITSSRLIVANSKRDGKVDIPCVKRPHRRGRVPSKFIARKLRASFVTAMRGTDCDYCDLQVYVGQSVGTVMSAHYDKPGIERLGKIAGLAQEMVEDY